MTDATDLRPDQLELEQLARDLYDTDRYKTMLADDLGIDRRTVHNWMEPSGVVPKIALVALRARIQERNFAQAKAHLAEFLRLMS